MSRTNWVESGRAFNEIHNIENMDRAHAFAAFVLLAEVLFGYWFSVPVLSIPFGSESPAGGTRVVASELALPTAIPETLPSEIPSSAPPEILPPDSLVKTHEGGETANEPNAVGLGDPSEVARITAPDDVRIVSLTPSSAISLWVGEVVNFEVIVEYNLQSADSGSVGLIIEECSCDVVDFGPIPFSISKPEQDQTLFRADTYTGVRKGRGRLTLNQRIRVPVAQHLDVEVHLANGSAASGPRDGQSYHVVDAGKSAASGQSTVKIVSILPAEASVLRVGATVEFDVVVEYNLASDFGTVRLTIENGDAHPLKEFSSENVKKGQRKIIFQERLEIPTLTSLDNINVVVRLTETGSRGMPTGEASGGATKTDIRTYNVVRP